jgi:fucose 4-O-acetylase-like acetyltransferase
VDAVRAMLLVLVVLLHSLMAGVSRDALGAPVLANAMEGWPGFAALTWLAQIMPLFFVLGGFAAYTQFSRERDRGRTATEYIAGRLRRLLLPTAAAVAAAAVFLATLVVCGVPAEVVATAGFHIGQPLWFLAVYLGCSALVPFMMRWHETHPHLTIAVLAAGVIGVDIVGVSTGAAAFGLINMAFVWLLLQQLGFALADGSFDGLSGRVRAMIVAGAIALLATGMLAGFFSVNLLEALNPPQGALVLVGIAQTMIFLSVRGRLRDWAERPRVAAAVAWMNLRAMTIYSWHMLVVIALAGALLLLPVDLPVPLTPDWWLARPLWFAVVGAAVWAVVRVAGVVELRRDAGWPAVGTGRAVGAVVCGVAGVVLALLGGSNPSAWVVAAALTTAAITAVRPGAPSRGDSGGARSRVPLAHGAYRAS